MRSPNVRGMTRIAELRKLAPHLAGATPAAAPAEVVGIEQGRGGSPRRVGRRAVIMGKADIDKEVFRRVMSHFPTGVTVVAARDGDGEPYGLTVNSFTSVSLDPPLILVCIDHDSSSHDRLLEARTFTVSVLAADQAHIAARFSSTPSAERFRDLVWKGGPTGDPVVEGAAACLACSLRETHTAGDHTIVVGHVEAMDARDVDALVFYRRRYGVVAP